MAEFDPLWFKDAILYQLHVKAFCDSDDNGVGDFRGLSWKLDYIKQLGVDTIWLLPFYPSPLRDDGYDISDYRGIHPDYGTLKDFRHFIRAAKERGLRVVTELVINHTSDQHPWFQRARSAGPNGTGRDYYVWSESHEKYAGTRIIFTDTEKSNWAWDEVAGAYYWHRFFSHQPDLNFDNPRVVREVISIMRYWLGLGIDGMRLDAVPYLCEQDGTNNENLPQTHAILKQLRAALDYSHPGRMLLAEANQWPEDVLPYFGQGDECHMAFHFPLMPRMYMAIAREDRHPITDIIRQTPEIPDSCQWAIFLRNHDELTLEMVTDRERDYLWSTYAADIRARVNIGIRRRLAPLMDNDRRKIELLNSLLFSMPGTPVIYYGDEIGMGDNIYLGDRNGVRTPMQWSEDRNGGFSRADPAKLYLPVIMDAVYGYRAVNVESQLRHPSSLLHWMQRMIGVRKSHKVFGRGTLRFLYPGNRKILAYIRDYQDESVLCIANLSRTAQGVELDLSPWKGCVPVELTGPSPFPPIGDLPYFLTLPAYGFYWFLISNKAEAPPWHQLYGPAPPDLITVVIRGSGWDGIFGNGARRLLENEAFPIYLSHQRWCADKDSKILMAEILHHVEFDEHGVFALLSAHRADGKSRLYLVPLAIDWNERDEPLAIYGNTMIARLRKGAKAGVLFDAIASDGFVQNLAHAIAQGRHIDTPHGRLRCFHTKAISDIEPLSDMPSIRRLSGEQSNSSVVIDDKWVIKFLRRPESGPNSELEITKFLTETAHFPFTPALIGGIALEDETRHKFTLALVHAFIANQGDGWSWITGQYERLLDEIGPLPEAEMRARMAENVLGDPLGWIRLLGDRTAHMHQALSLATGDPDFDPEQISRTDISLWQARITGQVQDALEVLRDHPDEIARALLSKRDDILPYVRSLLPEHLTEQKIRIHGDYHLGQVLVVKNDVSIIDFEGEPAHSHARHDKDHPLRDVASMMRSFSYAAWHSLSRAEQTWPDARLLHRSLMKRIEAMSVEAFLQGYGEIEDKNLLHLFLIEKACYEICYEAAHRPAWLAAPIHGLAALLHEKVLRNGDSKR